MFFGKNRKLLNRPSHGVFRTIYMFVYPIEILEMNHQSKKIKPKYFSLFFVFILCLFKMLLTLTQASGFLSIFNGNAYIT